MRLIPFLRKNTLTSSGASSQRHALLLRNEKRERFKSALSRQLFSCDCDLSYSMSNVAPQVQQCTADMLEFFKCNPAIGQRVEIEFYRVGGSVQKIQPFAPALDIVPPSLSVGGNTPLGAAALTALKSIKARVNQLRTEETEVASSILLIISDGEANDNEHIPEAMRELRAAAEHNITVIPLLTVGGNGEALRDFCGCDYLDASTTDIKEVFQRLTAAMRVVSQTSASQIDSSFVRNLVYRGQQ